MEREKKQEDREKSQTSIKKSQKQNDNNLNHTSNNGGWNILYLGDVLKTAKSKLQHDKSADNINMDFKIDVDKLKKLQEETIKRRETYRPKSQLRLKQNKSQVNLQESSKKPMNPRETSLHSYKSHKQLSNWELKPTTINHFTGKPLNKKLKRNGQNRSQNLLKPTFTSTMKKTKKSPMHIENMQEVIHTLHSDKKFKQNNTSQLRIKKQESIQNQLQDKILNILAKDPSPSNAKTELLIHKANLMNKKQQSPIDRNRVEQNNNIQQFINQTNWTYESPEPKHTKRDYDKKYTHEDEFSFQNASSQERSNSKDRTKGLYGNYAYLTKNKVSDSPMKGNQPQRRTRAQRLQKPDKESSQYLGGSSSQKRATDIVIQNSPRVLEIKRQSSSRASKTSRRASLNQSTGRKHLSRNNSKPIREEDENPFVSAHPHPQYSHTEIYRQDTTSDDYVLHTESVSSRDDAPNLITQKSNEIKRIPTRDEYRKQQEALAREKLKKIKSQHSPRGEKGKAGKHTNNSNMKAKKSPRINNNNMKGNDDQKAVTSKLHQEVSTILMKQQQKQGQQKGVPGLKSNHLFGN